MNVFRYPLPAFLLSLGLQWLSAVAGSFLRDRKPLAEDQQHDLGVVVAAALTLLGLIIGFSFSMAVSRYDQRKNYEEAEANAIGTEYARASLLPAGDATRVQELLKNYTELRLLWYMTRDEVQLQKIESDTARLQDELWSAVQRVASLQPTPVVALSVSGMNDVFNSQGYTQAAWWNRIPIAAWILFATVAMCCNLLFGYSARQRRWVLFSILPVLVSISVFLIADIDTPRRGVIRVAPQNLSSLSQTMRPH